jgi:hypothetical protein
MPRPRIALALLTFFLLAGARQRAVQHPAVCPSTGAPRDVFTYAEPEKVTTRHLTLDLTPDFESSQLHGRATLEIENRAGTRTPWSAPEQTFGGEEPYLYSFNSPIGARSWNDELRFTDATRAHDLFQQGREHYYPMLEQEIANMLGISVDNVRRLKDAA